MVETTSRPTARDLKVKAWFILPMETGEENLTKIQNRLRRNLERKGFTQVDDEFNLFGPAERHMDFYQVPDNRPSESDLPITVKLKSVLGSDVDEEMKKIRLEKLSEHFEGLMDEYPYRYVFNFEELQLEDGSGYDVQIKATPLLLRMIREYDNYSGYNVDDAVEQTKDEVENVIRSFEVEPYRGPYTEAEVLDPLLTNEEQNILKKHNYGESVLEYIDQGDRCLQDDMLHASLSCYIHAIEWTIIHYKNFIEDIDLIERQTEDNEEKNYLYYREIVKEIEHETPASRMTIEAINKLNGAERRWIAHHREGSIPRANVETARENLGKLIREIFREETNQD